MNQRRHYRMLSTRNALDLEPDEDILPVLEVSTDLLLQARAWHLGEPESIRERKDGQ